LHDLSPRATVIDGRDVGFNMSNPRKRIVVLCALLVVGGGWVAQAWRYPGAPNGAQPQAAGDRTPLLSDPNQFAGTNVSLGGRELFLKMMLSVVLVIVLGFGALYLSKRVLPKVTNAAGREIRIIETTYLGPRKALHLVEVAHQRLLIASTSDHVTALAHIGDAWLDVPRPEVDDRVKT
jgi:flagellar biosynthetic protein FliO